jgi:ABC-type branched-subunit amino acid transport system ATPase component
MPTSASDVSLDIDGLTAGYRSVTVVRDLSLVVRKGEFVALLGANGVGKTTLLRAVVGAARIISGRIMLNPDPPLILVLQRHIHDRPGVSCWL